MYIQSVEIGIINTHTGKMVKKKIINRPDVFTSIDAEDVISAAEKMSKWFNDKATFFSPPVWQFFAGTGQFVERIYKLLAGGYSDDICESAVVDIKVKDRPYADKIVSIPHEFYIKRLVRQ